MAATRTPVKPAPASSQATAVASGKAHFDPELATKKMRLNFFEASYNGGSDYKFALDASGQSVLVPHENELNIPVGAADGTAATVALQLGLTGSNYKLRYYRRQRLAVYDNQFKPIVEKVVAYVMENEPVRPQKYADEFDRLRSDWFMKELLNEGLKFSEAWVGFDTAKIDESVDTVAKAAEADPKNAGRPYIVLVDPRRIVDYDEDDGVITRVAIEEVVRSKGSLLAEAKTESFVVEWTKDSWVRYRTDGTDGKLVDGGGMTEVDRGTHRYGVCPYFRLKPKFPTADVCELSKAIFNLDSLCDEELWGNTFTQLWATGVKKEELQDASRGVGNILHVESDLAKFGVLGADTSQVTSILSKIERLSRSLFASVSMDVGAKNVAESAEKKKRDLEGLYSLLSGLAEQLEYVDNQLHIGMGVLLKDSLDERTQYSRDFDVESLSELRDELVQAFGVSMFPASYRRKIVSAYMAKSDPFGDHKAYDEELERMVDIDPTKASALRDLLSERILTGEMVADLLAVPEKMRADFIKRFDEKEHQDIELEEEMAQQQADLLAGKPVGQDDEEAVDEDGNPIESDKPAKPGVTDPAFMPGRSAGKRPPFGGKKK